MAVVVVAGRILPHLLQHLKEAMVGMAAVEEEKEMGPLLEAKAVAMVELVVAAAVFQRDLLRRKRLVHLRGGMEGREVQDYQERQEEEELD
jgi:hypothetical protein